MDLYFAIAAQYDNPPTYFVNRVCDAIDAAVDADTLGKVYAGLVAEFGDFSCISLTDPSAVYYGWYWQVYGKFFFFFFSMLCI